MSPSESEALPMIEMLISRMIGPARQSGELLYYSIPGEPLDTEVNLGYHKKSLQSMIQKLGYNAKPINEGLAVVFAELSGDEHFTGIGMSFGGGMVNVCFAYRYPSIGQGHPKRVSRRQFGSSLCVSPVAVTERRLAEFVALPLNQSFSGTSVAL